MSFKKGILSTFLSKVIVAALGLVMVIIISRHLGAEGRGKIGLFMSVVALLQLFCDFGNSSAIINLSYQLPQRKLWLSSILWVGAVCLISYPILMLFEEISFVYLIPPAAFLFSMINLNQMLLMGRQQVQKRNLSLIMMPAFIIPGFLLLFFKTELGISAYPAALFIALGLSLSISRGMLGPYIVRTNTPFAFEKEILKQGFWVQSAQTLQFLNYRLNFFLVAYFISESALGVYNNAVILCESIWILGHSIGQMQHLKILNTKNEKEHLRLSKKLIIYNLSGSFVLSFLLLAVPNSFWTMLFTGDFETMRGLFYYLIPGVLFFSISNIIHHFLHAKNLFKHILFSNGFGLVVGLITALICIPRYGLEGACVSWSAGLLASMLSYLFQFNNIKIRIHKQMASEFNTI